MQLIFPRYNLAKGNFLIASPNMPDQRFKKSIILICENKPGSSFGIVVNKPIVDQKLKDIFETEDLGFGASELYSGGPVEKEKGFVIHSTDSLWKNSLKLNSKIAVTNLKDAITTSPLNGTMPKHLMITMGYANWVENQLDNEIKIGFWVPTNANAEELIFNTPTNEKWISTLNNRSINPNTFSPYTGIA